MYFKQFYLGCLSHASYLVGSDGHGVVIDPQRDVDQYVEEATEQGYAIDYVIETHLHADFVSGHKELAERTGANIVMGHRAGARFDHVAVKDGDTLDAGSLRMHMIETPGHTPEAISILVEDRSDASAPKKLFTGDTLFIGDVGRPDLSGSSGFTPEQMAGLLYDTLHHKLLTLDDTVEVYPAHGAGSLCGRNMSKETWSTIGAQRLENYALKPMSKDAFIAIMTAGMPEVPAYFARDVALNREGAPPLGALPSVRKLSPEEVLAQWNRGTLLLDIRPSEIYGPLHIPGSLNIGLDGQFASWAGTLIESDRPIILIGDSNESLGQALTRLARVGFTSVVGGLDGGFHAWKDAGLPTAGIALLPIDEFYARVSTAKKPLQLLDVRRPAEFATGAVIDAESAPLAELTSRIPHLDREAPTYAMCASGYRSSIATSILESAGFTNLINIDGGMDAYNAAGYPVLIPAES
ncbi:MAG: MBL fold metallo-hydrolase [Vulcanimicrobiaceae bacterium]